MGNRKIYLILLLIQLIPAVGIAQPGDGSFSFVDVPSFARLTGLGGYLVSQPNTDVNLVLTNPAQSGDSLDFRVAASYMNYFADVQKMQFAYQHRFSKAGSWFAAVDHIGYGSLEGYDETGQAIGEFKSGETLVLVGTSHQVGIFRLGASLKFISSNIARFGANAMALDLGGTFKHPRKDFAVGLVVRNLGAVISDYDEGASSELPFDVQAGVSFKPEFMPLRFHLTLFNLTDWDTADGLEGPGSVDMFFRHLNVGTELLLHKRVHVRFGYNHLNRKELRLENAAGGAGISYGIVFFVKAFSFAYSRGGYHVAGGAHNVTITIDTKSLFRKGIKL